MKDLLRLALASCLLALPALPAAAEDIPSEATAQKICATVAHYSPGPRAQATDADQKLYAQTDCEAFFYAFPTAKRDYEKGRRCALVQKRYRELALLFANAWGGPRDYDAATYFLCQPEQEMAPAEIWSMLDEIQKLRRAKAPAELDFCSHVTSGYGMQWCTHLDAERQAVERDVRLGRLRKGLPPAALPALQALEKAAAGFTSADAEAAGDTSRGGSMHPAEVLSERTAREDAFAALLEQLASHRAPAVTPEALKQADTQLNQAYKKALATFLPAEPGDSLGPQGPEILKKAQRAWLVYRDAWVVFYRARWEGAAPAAALDREATAALTRARSAELEHLLTRDP